MVILNGGAVLCVVEKQVITASERCWLDVNKPTYFK